MEALGLLRGLPLGAVEGLERAEAVIGRYRPGTLRTGCIRHR